MFRTDEVSNFWPAIAVPMTVKMPEPITAPMPSAVSDKGPSDFFRLWAGSSDSRISLSMDLVAKICFDRVLLLKLHRSIHHGVARAVTWVAPE